MMELVLNAAHVAPEHVGNQPIISFGVEAKSRVCMMNLATTTVDANNQPYPV
jgi:hypothetical protein